MNPFSPILLLFTQKLGLGQGHFKSGSGNCLSSYVVASVTRSLHLNHNILSVPLFSSHLLMPFPHIHTHYANTWYLSSFIYILQANASYLKPTQWMILRNIYDFMKDNILFFLIFLPVFKMIIVHNTNYITYNDGKMERVLDDNMKIGALFVD